MQHILLVEDSKMFAGIIKKRVEQALEASVFLAKNYAEAENLLNNSKRTFSLALLDYNLPDAPNGEIIERVTQAGISSIVFTSNITEEVRSFVWSKKVADYVLKDDPNSLDYIISIIKKMEANQNNLVLVVDDSSTFRSAISELLYIRKYRVLNASDGKSCLEIIERHPEVKLVITDYNMPLMNGWQLCQKIREKHKVDSLAIIGMSSDNDQSMGARFIKSGANDYLMKHSFLVEEFYARVEHSLETINLFEQIHDSAVKDFLTGLYNRRYFFDAGEKLFQRCRAKGNFIACAMIDIDFFKKVNDTYGHDVGDIVIKKVASALQDILQNNEVLARVGGEEFCILVLPQDIDDCRVRFETLRKAIENISTRCPITNNQFSVSISTGICVSSQNTLNEMVKVADECLYQAKTEGRNRVIISDIQ